ncbi:conserved membrane protein of unknown function [Nitrospira sp. KM1]|uniref:hypothetical protein n=1 Tax=Nitrospira sp. KM1 TaxID=1936990 RepID=UPI0013A785DB|nr:hypothetical protein [Nitrospira sp. KM1]BCA54366.1 conserved membrane protein of unknown function [Nitrospira sp. KM1]
MLHRMALRVLPSLSLAVTEESVRRRKRLVMFVPGLVAFGIYRAAKHIVALDEPAVLLAVSGLVACVTALAAYRVGRGTSWPELLREDGNRLLTWIAGWIGFVYGVQLSLLVLGLLWLVGYDYLQHPDGPAMMAIIISCTAVARDAFEIGHVRRIGLLGRPFPTFPDGMALRNLLGNQASELRRWVSAGIIVGAAGAVSGYFLDGDRAAVLMQLAAVTVLCGAVALCAFFGGRRPQRPWIRSLFETKPQELLKYWWWPGLAFASTYYIVTAGTVIFLFRQPGVSTSYATLNGGLVGALMALYGYYLGFRRQVEEEQGRSVPEALLRCPFVMGILGKTANAGTTVVAPASKG